MQALKRDADTLRSVTWPSEVKRKISKLLDLDVEEVYRLHRAYNHKSFQDSLASGDWGDKSMLRTR